MKILMAAMGLLLTLLGCIVVAVTLKGDIAKRDGVMDLVIYVVDGENYTQHSFYNCTPQQASNEWSCVRDKYKGRIKSWSLTDVIRAGANASRKIELTQEEN